MGEFVQVHINFEVVHVGGYLCGRQFTQLVKHKGAFEDIDELKKFLAFLFSKGLAIIEAKLGQLLFKLYWPPERRVDHSSEDWAPSCLINTELELQFFDVFVSIFL